MDTSMKGPSYGPPHLYLNCSFNLDSTLDIVTAFLEALFWDAELAEYVGDNSMIVV